MFSPVETEACQRLVTLALCEDLGSAGDITSQAIIPESLQARVVFVARSAGVLAGLPAAAMVIAAVNPRLAFEPLQADGATLQTGARIATVSGPMRSILAAERTALNFLQRLSGIATLTRRYVDAVAGLPCQILDTRKTTPGWRLLEKYAVRQGGGHNHRMGLYDGILIKDNHLAAIGGGVDAGLLAIQASYRAGRYSVEVEVENLDQFDRCLSLEPEIILLDNMSLEQMREAARRRDECRTPKSMVSAPLLEASGGITLANVRAIAETGVDRISIGALTHSAPALDIALDYLA
jgi:nicotinate-nucleotide pyrophosphorylase (carboxylating)